MKQIQVRRAVVADAAALSGLVAGLSPWSAFLRFFAVVRSPSPRLLAGLLRQDAGHGAWVAAVEDRLVGHASWGCEGGAVELGVVVAEGWRRQGLGRALLAGALGEAAGLGLTDVRLHVHAENTWLVRRLSAGATSTTRADGVVTVTRPLADLLPTPAPGPAPTELTVPTPLLPPVIMQERGSSVIPRVA